MSGTTALAGIMAMVDKLDNAQKAELVQVLSASVEAAGAMTP